MRNVSWNLVNCCTTAGVCCTINPQQIEVTELDHYGRRTCNIVCASSHDASTVIAVVNKLDRRRVLLTTRSTCRGDSSNHDWTNIYVNYYMFNFLAPPCSLLIFFVTCPFYRLTLFVQSWLHLCTHRSFRFVLTYCEKPKIFLSVFPRNSFVVNNVAHFWRCECSFWARTVICVIHLHNFMH